MNRNWTIEELIANDREREAQIGTIDIRDDVELGAIVDGRKRIPVAGEPDWVWVTIDGRSATKVKRGRANVSDRYGDRLKIGRENGNSYYTILEVIGRGLGTGSNNDTGSGTVPHADQHRSLIRWRQQLGVSEVRDTVYVRSLQITDLLIQPSSGFRFKVLPGVAKVDGTDLAFPDGLSFDIDDTQVPASAPDAVICRVELTDTGTIALSYSSDYAEPVTEQDAIDNAPAATSGRNTLGYIWMPAGMTGGAYHHILPASLAERTGGAINNSSSSLPNYGSAATKTLASDIAAAGSDRNLVIAAQTGTADNLIEITGLAVGDAVVVRADSGDTITVKHNSGSATDKILLYNGLDIALTGNQMLELVKVESGKVIQPVDEKGGTAPGGAFPKRWTMWHYDSLVLAGNALLREHDANAFYTERAYQNAAAQNDEFTNGFLSASGSYTLVQYGVDGTNRGIVEWFVDGVSQGTTDWYDAGTARKRKTLAITVTTDGWHTLRGLVATKHASSSDYFMILTQLVILPSAD